ncbi:MULTISPECIES: putative ABC transporter permease [Eubacteriales]|uniref:putative ABC transporter permease n=1 Tax=Eubacteriales TaxID=186802 RepID=UPI00110651FE|nr:MULTISPECIES: putative ABC transporter permease [Eubacteriales]
MQIYRLLLYFFLYSFLGWCTEVAYATVKERRFVNRGFLGGPWCPIYGVGVSAVVTLLDGFQDSLLLLYLSSFVLVTLIEGMTGFIMDKIFHHKWWDYTGLPFNIGGYVCLPFSIAWGAACLVIVKGVHPVIERLVGLLPEAAGLALICVLTAGLAADLAVTTAGILKLNRRLDMLERIGAELREISDRMGANIHENVMDAMERAEVLENMAQARKERLDAISGEAKERLDLLSEETRERYDMLRQRYAELTGATLQASRRLVKAFPRMESRRHKELLEELKRKLEEVTRKR